MWWVAAAYLMLSLTVASSLLLAAASPLVAQPRGFVAPRPNPSISNEDQLAPSQMNQPTPPAVSEPPSPPASSTSQPARSANTDATTGSAASARKLLRANRTVIACSGPFAQDSGMLALAVTFGAGNIIFTEEKVEGSEVGATVLYPKNAKRRLEVWWSNPNRTGLYLIDIAGKSVWTGPDGLRLGLTLPEVEKINHKPFKLKGLDKDGVATVSDWNGGALATLAGGCKASVSFHTDSKSSKDAVSAFSADQEFSSADPTVHAAKLTVSEILIGY